MRPRTFPAKLKGGEVLTQDDPFEEIHWRIVVAHPKFQDDLDDLREEIELVFPDREPEELRLDVLLDPEKKWPLLNALSKCWGIPPSALIDFAYISPDKVERLRPGAAQDFRNDAHGLVVSERDSEYVIRIPRPLTKSKKRTLISWLESLPSEGPREAAWDRAGRKRHQESWTLIEALPWFIRWNSDSKIDPIDIWRDLTKPGGEIPITELDVQTFFARLIRVWERMRKLSPQGIREDAPSKKIT